MIRAILRVSWLNLRRDRVALALTFLLPVAFFSVFALVFGGMDRGAARNIEAALVVEEETPGAVRMRELLISERGLRLVTARATGETLTRVGALDLIQRGRVDAAIVIPAEFSARFAVRRLPRSCSIRTRPIPLPSLSPRDCCRRQPSSSVLNPCPGSPVRQDPSVRRGSYE